MCFFFGQQIKSEKLHICMSSNIGEQILKIVKESNNEAWKVHYSELFSENV